MYQVLLLTSISGAECTSKGVYFKCDSLIVNVMSNFHPLRHAGTECAEVTTSSKADQRSRDTLSARWTVSRLVCEQKHVQTSWHLD